MISIIHMVILENRLSIIHKVILTNLFGECASKTGIAISIVAAPDDFNNAHGDSWKNGVFNNPPGDSYELVRTVLEAQQVGTKLVEPLVV